MTYGLAACIIGFALVVYRVARDLHHNREQRRFSAMKDEADDKR